jgi:Zn-dependent M28 family amino/carboxypeptidase
MLRKIYLVLVLVISVITGCKVGNNNLDTALSSITEEGLKKQISAIASDDFQGRGPATPGEQKTISYLAEQFKEEGLEPGNNGSYFQEVSLIKMTTDTAATINISGGKSKLNLKYHEDFTGNAAQTSDEIKIDNSGIIFVGYGVNSPEDNWNDYAGLDVKGKTVLILVNDPGYTISDSTLFSGKTMTYYGRWTYKYEEAARQGAKAAIIIHETDAAGYPWGVVQNSWSGPQFSLVDNDFLKSDLQVKSWITRETAEKIFESAGLDYSQLRLDASKKGFKPVDMKLTASILFKNKVEYTKSNNVVALLPGTDRSGEYIIYTAHWDHFGINSAFKGDSILNGAVDNGTGTAALVEIARAFTKAKPARSILFLSVTCEEQGLLGSEFYAHHPLYPLEKTVAVINMDALNIFGKSKDMTIVGYGNSQLDSYAERVLQKYGRYAIADPTPEKGGYFRSDHFSFGKVGVPSLYLAQGVNNVEHGKEWGLAAHEKWINDNYHKPSDNYEPDKWNFDGLVEDVKVYFETGYDLSISEEFPEWSAGFPFKSLRDQMMKKE